MSLFMNEICQIDRVCYVCASALLVEIKCLFCAFLNQLQGINGFEPFRIKQFLDSRSLVLSHEG